MHPLVTALQLESNLEGGYYRQVYESAETTMTANGARPLATTIYYLLTLDSPIGHFHRNESAITHFLHTNGPVRYLMVTPQGDLREEQLGWDLSAGQVSSFTCPGGWWKSSHLMPAVDYCLISEIVAPGFSYDDHAMATVEAFERDFPQLVDQLRPYIAS